MEELFIHSFYRTIKRILRLLEEIPRHPPPQPPCVEYDLWVSIVEARNLPSVNLGGGCDPYCRVSSEGEVGCKLVNLWKKTIFLKSFVSGLQNTDLMGFLGALLGRGI